MENQDKTNEIAYKKAQKRVKDIKTYYYLVTGFFLVGGFLLYRNYDGNIFNLSQEYTTWMVMFWAIFLIGLGIYMFVPYFHNWEERKTKELMNKYKK